MSPGGAGSEVMVLGTAGVDWVDWVDWVDCCTVLGTYDCTTSLPLFSLISYTTPQSAHSRVDNPAIDGRTEDSA